jgi:alpha-pyrone synthase
MTYITGIETAVPANSISPESFADWAAPFFGNEETLRKLRFLAKASGIDKKYCAIPDFGKSINESVLYNHPDYSMPSTGERMQHFLPLAADLAHQAAEKITNKVSSKEITHIIAVSCTGLIAPGLEISLCKSLGLSQTVQRSAVNFMGCYAAFHALKQAHYICKSYPESKVLIVAVELCSLHFRNCSSSDNLLSSMLFADGAAAVLMEGLTSNKSYLQTVDFHSALISEGEKDMAWEIGDTGFQMQLKNQIPEHIKNNIREVFEKLLQKNKITEKNVEHFAIHPGGKNILQGFAEALQCETDDLCESFRVLKEFGNMSSVSVLFVLKALLDNPDISGYIYSAAFGPGLTVESGIFQKSAS